MARIRTVKPEFWASEALATRLPGPDGRQARLLFIALWNHAEDHGVCRASPALLRSVAFPYDDDVTAGDVARWLGMLAAGRFVVLFQRDGSAYAWIRGFSEHQKIDRKSKTTLPGPSLHEREPSTSPRDTSSSPPHETITAVASPRRALDEPSLQEGKGREGKGEDLPSGETASRADAVAPPPTGEGPPDATADAHPVDESPTRPALVLETQRAEKPSRKPSVGEQLYARLEAQRQKACEEAGLPFLPSNWPHARMNKDLGTMARAEKADPDAFERFKQGFFEFLDDEAARNADVPWPLDWFWKQRSRYEGRALRAAGGET